MFDFTPKRFFLTSGTGEASTKLNAFDAALLKAGIGDTNLIKLSSILPPGIIETLPYQPASGSFVPLAYAEHASCTVGETISAAVAVGIPLDRGEAGLIMECSGVGTPEVWEQTARDMVLEGMEKIRNRKIREIKSTSASITVATVGAVFAAVVLCP
ncbi:MAG: arginine decarboxylase [Thermodesulfobacteriota bacterium]|nr:arginine decarboxylase [Thermodesulfobacteriota bacterium]